MKVDYPSYATVIEQLRGSVRHDTVNTYHIVLSLLSYILAQPQTEILKNLDKQLTIKQLELLGTVISKLESQTPLSYILGNNNFYGLDFLVTKEVLIPRPETELLVSLILNYLDTKPKMHHVKVLEVGTGSGCIPISILTNSNRNLAISSIDISPTALTIAKQNAELLLSREQSEKILFICKNILTEAIAGKYDIIVSNPPYISEKEYTQLDSSLYYEPKIALTDQFDGLTFYRKFIDLINVNLSPSGVAFFEIHSAFAKKVENIFNNGVLRQNKCIIHKDLFGRDRVIEIKSI